MKNKLEKQLRSFIDFDYSKRTIDRFHRWMISSDSAEEKETALRNLWFKTKGKAEHDMEYSFRQVLDKIGIEYTPMEFVEICCGSCCYCRSICDSYFVDKLQSF